MIVITTNTYLLISLTGKRREMWIQKYVLFNVCPQVIYTTQKGTHAKIMRDCMSQPVLLTQKYSSQIRADLQACSYRFEIR